MREIIEVGDKEEELLYLPEKLVISTMGNNNVVKAIVAPKISTDNFVGLLFFLDGSLASIS